MAEAVVNTKAPRGRKPPPPAAPPQLDTEVANRFLDPFETLFNGLIRTNDPLLLEKGEAANGAALYRDLKRDGKVFSCLQKRIGALVGKPWAVAPVTKSAKGDADAAALTELLKQGGFDRLCKELMEALLPGSAICETVWTVADGYYRTKRTPRRALRRFAWVQEDATQPPALRLLTRENMLTGVQLPQRCFIVHRINPEDDNPWGTGLGLQLYWAVFFKRKALVSWNKLNDRMGIPVPWGKYRDGAGDKEKATLFSALRALSNDGVIMTPASAMIEMLESKLASGGITSQQALCEYMDDWIAEVILGQEPRRKGAGAPVAAGNERTDVRMDLVQADSDLLSETLNATLIPWMCELNGFVPCVVSRQIKEEEDLKAVAETDKTVSDMGFELDVAKVREKYGEGWNKKAAPEPPPGPSGGPAGGPAGASGTNPAAPAPGAARAAGKAASGQFSEPGIAAGQQAIDDAIAAVSDAELQSAMQGLIAPLLAAIDQAHSFEDALAAAELAYPRMDKTALQSLLARAMFGAEAYGRQTAD